MSGRVISTRRDTDSSAAPGFEDGGGNVDDILKRLGNLEANGYELKSQVSAILAIIPHLATKADLMESVADLSASIADVRESVADVRTSVADVRTSVAAVETVIIKWFIATTLATGGLAFTIAKWVH
jgi:hypothetical protein